MPELTTTDPSPLSTEHITPAQVPQLTCTSRQFHLSANQQHPRPATSLYTNKPPTQRYRRALYWDHCHSHGLFRGPLCVKCNNSEGAHRFIDRPGGVEHLLQCADCRAQRTLPLQHHADIVRRLAVFEPHAACTHKLSWRWFYAEDDGSVVARFRCYQHQPELAWSVTVPSDEVKLLVRRFVDEAIGSGR
ncbi:endonuclease domain-containing protein [Streptomyces cyaneofuscatus]